MLSRIARAPRQGLSAARLAPALRARPVALSISPWIRTYGKNRGPSNRQWNSQKPPAQPSQPGNVPNAAPSGSSPSSAAPSGSSPSPPPNTNPSKPAGGVASAPARPQSDAVEPPTDPEHLKDPEPISFDKLPDLTRGIPSTLEQEMEERSGGAQSSLQAVDPDESSGGRGRRDSHEPYVSTNERNRRWWTRFLLLATASGGALSVAYMGRNWEDIIEVERHPDIPNGWSPTLWWQRATARLSESVSYYQDPAFDKLLPDPDPSFERPYTLCLSLDDLLVHSEWSREHGWRVAKRPGVDYFVRYLSQYYELVLFTSVPFAMGEPLVRKLDPFRFIMWPLYREATKFEEGEIVKDLSYLNRDLSKVIIIDTNARHVRKQPENAIILKPWKGEAGDTELVSLIPFLEYIHTMQYSDARKVLKSFDGKHIPTEFARREAIARMEFEAQRLTQRKHSKPSGVGALGNMLGLKANNMSMTMSPDGEQNPSEAFAQGKMLQDIARERGQRNYELLEREIRENGEKWLKEEQVAMEKAQQEAMSSMMGTWSRTFLNKSDDDGANPDADKKP